MAKRERKIQQRLPVFYAYAYPEPDEFSTAAVCRAGASYNSELREFILPYDDVRQSALPDATLHEFLQSTCEATANCGAWERSSLEQTLPLSEGPAPQQLDCRSRSSLQKE